MSNNTSDEEYLYSGIITVCHPACGRGNKLLEIDWIQDTMVSEARSQLNNMRAIEEKQKKHQLSL